MNKLLFILLILLPLNILIAVHENKLSVYELKNLELGWNRLELEDSLLSSMSSTYSQIRLNLVNESMDTLEVPYIIESTHKIDSIVKIPIEIVNKTTKDGRQYYTLIADSTQIISSMQFSFGGRKYLGSASLEGSNDQEEWFMIADSFLLGERVNRHQKISSKSIYDLQTLYKFYRLSTEESKSELKSVTYEKVYSATPKYKRMKVKIFKEKIDTERNTTVVHFTLAHNLPIQFLKVQVSNKFDYIRNADLYAVVDSTKTDKGKRYSYKLLESFVLNSTDTNNFTFSYPDHYRLYKLEIRNENNPPLKIRRLTPYRYEYILKARFDHEGKSYIEIANYGSKPYYDIEKFKARIPKDMNKMKIGKRIESAIVTEDIEPLFSNVNWLWGIILLTVLVVGVFSLRMLKGEVKKK